LHGCDVAIVDYLNKVRVVDRNGMNSAQLRGQDIEDFKVCLEETGVVGLMAAQFDKAAKRLKSRSLADARDTGELDDKANVGIVIDRPLDEENHRSETARVSIVKCNAGQEGSVEMVFRGERLMFYPVERVALGGA
jgi:replicative DNA helicase